MSPPNQTLRARVLEGHSALAGLREPWSALCDQCPWATPFQRPEWLLAWARQHRAMANRDSDGNSDSQPWTVVVYEHDRLVGLAPLFRYQRPGPHGARVLALLGAGASDYGDVLAMPGREQAVVRAMLSALAHRRARWDVCEIDEVRPSISPLTRVALPRGWARQASTQSTCPSLELPGSVEELARCVPPRHWRRFEQYRRRAARAGTLTLERATVDTCERMLDTLFALHSARWQARGERGGFADTRVRALHREAALSFARRDALALYALRIETGLHARGTGLNGRVLACLYGYEHDGTLYFYLGGFDPAAAPLSPGVLLLGLVLEDSVRRGLGRIDFLRGAEAYKYWWGAEDHHTVRLRLTLAPGHARATLLEPYVESAASRHV